jgi:ABC-type nitrate/sulfonate/bicarbonate transport system substrate-binding protein
MFGTTTVVSAGAHEIPSTKYKPIHITIGVTPANFNGQALYYLAEKHGFFKKFGIVPNFVPVSVPATPQALTSGAIDTVAAAVSTAISMRYAGANVRIIGPQWQTVPYDFVASVKSNIPVAGVNGVTWQQSIQAMVGTTIAYSGARGIGSGAYLDSYFQADGLNPVASYNFVSLPTGNPTVAAFTGGTVNVALVQPQTAVQLVKLGLGKVVIQVTKDGPPIARNSAFTGYYMMEAFIQAHPGIAARYLGAMTQTVAWAKEKKNLPAVVLEAVNDLVIEPNSYDTAAMQALLATLGATRFTKSQVQNVFTLLRRIGSLPSNATIGPKDVFTSGSVEARS